MDKFSELKWAAMAATPGRIGDRIDGSGSIKYECTGYDGSLVLRTDHKNMEYGFVGDNADADELFFRLCVPDVILALLAELEAKDKRIAELETAAVVPGALRCAKCQFQLTKTIICMKSGTTGAGDNKTEPCPNGCGPLWPVTWKQWAKEMDEQAGRYFYELKAAEAKLATPIRLPEGTGWASDPYNHGRNRGINECAGAIRAAGFKCERDER